MCIHFFLVYFPSKTLCVRDFIRRSLLLQTTSYIQIIINDSSNFRIDLDTQFFRNILIDVFHRTIVIFCYRLYGRVITIFKKETIEMRQNVRRPKSFNQPTHGIMFDPERISAIGISAIKQIFIGRNSIHLRMIFGLSLQTMHFHLHFGQTVETVHP